MRMQNREVTTGDKTGTYELNVPENVAEFIALLKSDDVTQNVTINVSGLMRLAEYAMKSWLIEKDNAARIALKGGKVSRKTDRFALGL